MRLDFTTRRRELSLAYYGSSQICMHLKSKLLTATPNQTHSGSEVSIDIFRRRAVSFIGHGATRTYILQSFIIAGLVLEGLKFRGLFTNTARIGLKHTQAWLIPNKIRK